MDEHPVYKKGMPVFLPDGTTPLGSVFGLYDNNVYGGAENGESPLAIYDKGVVVRDGDGVNDDVFRCYFIPSRDLGEPETVIVGRAWPFSRGTEESEVNLTASAENPLKWDIIAISGEEGMKYIIIQGPLD
jgi:hypothetical protein